MPAQRYPLLLLLLLLLHTPSLLLARSTGTRRRGKEGGGLDHLKQTCNLRTWHKSWESSKMFKIPRKHFDFPKPDC
jgi:hypothetical protein